MKEKGVGAQDKTRFGAAADTFFFIFLDCSVGRLWHSVTQLSLRGCFHSSSTANQPPFRITSCLTATGIPNPEYLKVSDQSSYLLHDYCFVGKHCSKIVKIHY